MGKLIVGIIIGMFIGAFLITIVKGGNRDE